MSRSDLYEETPQYPELPYTFVGVYSVLDRLVPSGLTEENILELKLEDLSLEATYRRFNVTPALAERMGLGDTVRCRIILDGFKGAALVMRSRNLFDQRRYGFYIQPESKNAEKTEDDFWERPYLVWQAPVRAFSLGKRYSGIEKLKVEDAWLSSSNVTDALIKSLLINDLENNVS
jgi:hypothetical protein